MTNKKSPAAIFFAWTLIILSIIRFAFVRSITWSFDFLPKAILALVIIYAVANNILNIVCGINILRQKEWARRLIVVLYSIWLVYTVFVVMPLNYVSVENMRTNPKYADKIMAGYDSLTPDRIEKLKLTKEIYVKRVLSVLHRTAFFVQLASAAYIYLVIYVFTRPKVKEQFNV